MIYIFKQKTSSKTWTLYGVAGDEGEAMSMCSRLAANGFRAKYEKHS